MSSERLSATWWISGCTSKQLSDHQLRYHLFVLYQRIQGCLCLTLHAIGFADHSFTTVLFDALPIGGSYSMLTAVTRPSLLRSQPPDRCRTSLFFSYSQKIVAFLELTVPWEDRVPAAHMIKVRRYNTLLASCESNGWAASHFSFEVGCRGFVAHSLLTCLKHLGFPRWWAKKVRK